MNLNGYNLADRNNRPSVDSRVGLKVLFMNDGEYIDPVEIVDVAIFPRSTMQSPSSLLGSNGLLDDAKVSSLAVAHFESSENQGWNSPDEYNPEDEDLDSSIFRVRQGEFVVVLDGIGDVSSYATRWGAEVRNFVSAAGDYVDVWTIKYPNASDTKVVINAFSLFNDNFYTTTEPLLIKSSNELITKKIPLGSKQDLKITTEFTVENKAITSSLRNLFKTSIAVNPQIKIEKINSDPNLPSRVEVSGFSDTSSLILTTAENTFILNWDTDTLKTHPKLLAGELGNMRGVYAITLRYNILTERIVAPLMYVQLV